MCTLSLSQNQTKMKKICTLFFAAFLSAACFAQIPNAGFETWDTSSSTPSYIYPAGWDSADSLTNLAGVYTCEQGSPGFSGNHYLKLTSRNVIGFGVAAGIALSGKIDFTTYLPASGYAFTGRPVSLTGEWQYAPAASTDTGSVSLLFTKWNGTSRDSVGFIYYKLPGSVTSWAAFSLPITYLKSENPDTAEIYFSSSTATTAAAGSYLYIDTLAFSSTSTAIVPMSGNTSQISIYPNPSQGAFTLNIPSSSNEQALIVVTNLIGQKILETTIETNTSATLRIDAAGIYFINAITNTGHWSKKIVVSR